MTTAEYVPRIIGDDGKVKIRDLEEGKWAGQDVDQLDVEAACGDPDDWFVPKQRLEAAKAAKLSYLRHKGVPNRWHPTLKRKKFEWGLIVIAGPMGAGKSTFAMIDAYPWHEVGHQVFHPGGFLIGRICSYAEMYKIVDNVPLYSIVIFDEAHSGLESGMSQTAGVSAFTQLMAGLRKKRCRVFLPSAMCWMLPPSVKRMTTEVWKPFKPDFRLKPGVVVGHGLKDPRNFVLGLDIYDNDPFARADDRNGGFMGFGPPSKTTLLGTTVNSRRIVMRAMALVDTFKPVDPSVARQHATKAAQDQAESGDRGFAPPSETGFIKPTDDIDNSIREFFRDCELDFVSTTDVSASIGVNSEVLGRRINKLFGGADPKEIRRWDRKIIVEMVKSRL